jgi:hypothetical protein
MQSRGQSDENPDYNLDDVPDENTDDNPDDDPHDIPNKNSDDKPDGNLRWQGR